MTFLTPHLDILPPAQKTIWAQLAPITQAGWVLHGGTAIALRLGHRQSVDFDFFSEQHLDKKTLLTACPLLATATTLQEAPDTLTLSVKTTTGPVKISFFGGFSCGRIGTPEKTKDKVLIVASLPDLLAHKLKTILQRPAAKDYQDIAALLRNGENLAAGLAGAATLWPTFQPATGLKALTFFSDGDLESLPEADKELLIEAAINVETLPQVKLLAQTLT